MLRFLLVTVVLFASLKGFTKTVLMPRDFLNPVVKARISADHEWKEMETFGNYYYGARTPERAISVKFDELVNIGDLEFEVLLSGTNRGPWMNFVNVAIFQDDKYIGFAPTSTSIIGTQSSGKAHSRFTLKEICEFLFCDFDKGVMVYFYLDPKLNREMKPIYKWDHVFGSYYRFQYRVE